jgi:hypothetical protein
MKIKLIIRCLIVLTFLILVFPAYVFINRISNDYPLREYIKDKFIDQLIDDMSFYSSSAPLTEIPIPSIYIELSDSALCNLTKQRDLRISALLNGDTRLISSSHWNYVSGKAIYHLDTFKIKIRLRGDMPSNYNRSLQESTMRFNVKNGKLLAGKRKLSLIRPALENGYYGYLFYKCFDDFGFISNDLEIVKMYFNGIYSGIRFLQEGFSKELLDSSERRNSPIFRFKNDCVDEQNRYNPSGFPEMIAYGEEKILKDTVLSTVYAKALNKYNEFIKGNIDVSTCFNIREYGRFFALCDVFLAHHSNKCQNIKLYFNPIIDKFEPIAWDPNCFERYNINLDIKKGHTQRFGEICNDPIKYPLHYVLSKNNDFLRFYTAYLKEYSQDSMVLKKINKYSKIISSTERALFRENFQERYDSKKILLNLSKIAQDFCQNQLLYGNYYIKEKELSIRSLSNLPIIIDSVRCINQTIPLNWIIPPNNVVEITIAFDSIKDSLEKVKIYSRIVNSKKNSKYEAKVFSKKE